MPPPSLCTTARHNETLARRHQPAALTPFAILPRRRIPLRHRHLPLQIFNGPRPNFFGLHSFPARRREYRSSSTAPVKIATNAPNPAMTNTLVANQFGAYAINKNIPPNMQDSPVVIANPAIHDGQSFLSFISSPPTHSFGNPRVLPGLRASSSLSAWKTRSQSDSRRPSCGATTGYASERHRP